MASTADKEKDLLHDINTYRKILNLPVLDENKKASCLAEEIAEDLGDLHCEVFRDYYPTPGNNSKIPNFQKNINKCNININTTTEGVIMPLCVPKLNSDDLFSNYTKSNRFTKYLNNSNYKSAGVGSEDDWMVFIVATNSSSGDFSSASSLLPHFLMAAFFFATLVLLSKREADEYVSHTKLSKKNVIMKCSSYNEFGHNRTRGTSSAAASGSRTTTSTAGGSQAEAPPSTSQGGGTSRRGTSQLRERPTTSQAGPSFSGAGPASSHQAGRRTSSGLLGAQHLGSQASTT
ncbi:hypothetical protein V8G54_031074 [Vigna mungo]|uniref:Uncharacterized GPI-anchored protein At5g19230-like domain-containing protein n=1 Tax=Vigna mungo TaxID=3915 RepID=A0AAQ3RNJ4_VIGMU